MPINASALIDKVKRELRITITDDDDRLEELVSEAVEQLQKFKCKTLVDVVTDEATQTTLSLLDKRFIVIYVALQYDSGDNAARWDDALSNVVEQVRDR